jgi:hypothetical protein
MNVNCYRARDNVKATTALVAIRRSSSRSWLSSVSMFFRSSIGEAMACP